jgi:hypothetical protein
MGSMFWTRNCGQRRDRDLARRRSRQPRKRDIPPIWFRLQQLWQEYRDEEAFALQLGLPVTCLLPPERLHQLKRSGVYPCSGCKHDRNICGGRV